MTQSDNEDGIPSDELQLAIETSATSKLHESLDELIQALQRYYDEWKRTCTTYVGFVIEGLPKGVHLK